MKIKVCGLTQPDNITAILAEGVDYIGLIFYGKSKRFAQTPSLQKWLAGADAQFAKTAKVGVFVNAAVDYILNTVHDYQLDYVQLHGSESPEYCAELKLLWSVNTLRSAKLIKAFSVDESFDFSVTEAYAASCEFFIFDTGGQKEHGGTGVKWDWSKLEEYSGKTPFLLSGGIGPEDAERVGQVQHPRLMGLDLNSRFESSPGVKEVDKLRGFLHQLG